MTVYKQLNQVQMDLEEYGETYLSEDEKKRWENRVLKKLTDQRVKRRKKYLGLIAAVLLAAGVSLGSGLLTVANVPIVGGLIETYLHGEEAQANFSAYKTAIGKTVENEYGKMTLNEVLIDGGRLLISSSFEPADGVQFHYRMHPMPTVLMNGQKVTDSMGAQSIEMNHTLFTVYNEVQIPNLPLGEEIHFQITYDNLDFDFPIDNPWVFEITVPTEQVVARSETIQFNQELPLENGQSIYLKRMIVTPISSVLYYDWPEGAPPIGFKIVSQSGEEILPNFMAIDGEDSYNRYETTLDLKQEKYYLVPIEDWPSPQAEHSGSVQEQVIPIN